MVYETLNKCMNDAWDIVQGRKKIVRNKIISNTDKEMYGWLAPDGKFYESDFGEHQTWASEYLLKEFEKGNIENLLSYDNPGDKLTEMGWILIHNQSGFQLSVTRDKSKRITIRQKDFLLEYFSDMELTDWIKKLDRNEI